MFFETAREMYDSCKTLHVSGSDEERNDESNNVMHVVNSTLNQIQTDDFLAEFSI